MNPTGLQMTYALDPINLVANGNARNQSVQILDNDFELRFLVAFSTGRFTAQIIDGATKRVLSDKEVIDTLQFGTAQNPFPLLSPYRFSKRGQILVNLTDVSGNPNVVRIAFIGVDLV